MTMTPEEKLAPVSQAQPPEHLALAREDRDAALIEQLNERAKLIVELLQMIRFGNQGFAGGVHIQRARRIIDGLPEAIAEGEANYRAYCLASPDHVHEGTLEELATCARMLDEYGIKEMPANEKGQIEFNRALMESTVGAINAYIVNHRQATEARMQERVRAETDWQDIATAPRDGTLIDVWRGGEFPRRVPDVSWREPTDSEWWVHGGDTIRTPAATWHDMFGPFGKDDTPTHWRPLPSPPAIRETPHAEG